VSGAFSIGSVPPGLVPASGAAVSLPVSAGGSAGTVAASGGAAQAGGALTGSTLTAAPHSPSVYLDPALDLVVLAFFDAQGNLTNTIPSESQLQAYRLQGGPAQTGATVSKIG